MNFRAQGLSAENPLEVARIYSIRETTQVAEGAESPMIIAAKVSGRILIHFSTRTAREAVWVWDPGVVAPTVPTELGVCGRLEP